MTATTERHGERGTYTRGCRCDLCRAANAEYGRRRQRRYAGVRQALVRGDDLTFLRRQLTARDALLAVSELPRGEVRGRRDEIARFLELIDNADHYRDQLLEVRR